MDILNKRTTRWRVIISLINMTFAWGNNHIVNCTRIITGCYCINII